MITRVLAFTDGCDCRYPSYFNSLVVDWVTHLPCNNAAEKGAGTCVPLGDKSGGKVCKMMTFLVLLCSMVVYLLG